MAVTINDACAPDTKLAGHRVDFTTLRKGGYDAEARMVDMDLDSIEAEILYPTAGLLLFASPDPEYRRACFTVYNDWLTELCAEHPSRLFGLALLDVEQPSWAVEELQRTTEAGLVGCIIPGRPRSTSYDNPRFAPLWEVASEHGLPVAIHAFTDRDARDLGRAPTFMDAPHEIQRTLSLLATSGVLDNHPGLRIVSAEFDAGWVPHFLDRLDRMTDRRGGNLSIQPCEAIRRQVSFGFQADRAAIALRNEIGTGALLWGSDYPHVSSYWPRSLEVLSDLLAGVPEPEQAAIVGGNATKLYRLSLRPTAAVALAGAMADSPLG